MPIFKDNSGSSKGLGPGQLHQSKIHMIGIGGCGMSAAAGVLLKMGAKVSGSDLQMFDGLGALVASGARISIGHRADLLATDTELVVISAAIGESNPELTQARSLGMHVIKYAELLGEIVDRCRGIAVAGTHGKSTTSAMCAYLFEQSGLSPSFIIGATSPQLGGSSRVGTGPHLIVESCEFDRSFLHLRPCAAAILNVEPDHLDCYDSFEEIVEAFGQFSAQVHEDGLLVCNAEDRWAMDAAKTAKARVETFGFEDYADWQACGLESDRGMYAFTVLHNGKHVLTTKLGIPGRYNVANALAAIVLAHHAGADPEKIGHALATFSGLNRRMTLCGQKDGITIVDDYAHHPTELRLTVEAAKNRYQPTRTWVVFQPHQYSRTRHFLKDFAQSLCDVDEIVVTDVYDAREVGASGCTIGSRELVSRIAEAGGRAKHLASLSDAAEHVAERARAGDLILTMGAGDVWKVANELVERLCRTDRTQRANRTADVVPTGGKSPVSVPTS